MPSGDWVLHLDLHPMNVTLTSDGPVVIDWTNAIRGDGWFDAAISSVVLSTAELAAWRGLLGARILRVGPRGVPSAASDEALDPCGSDVSCGRPQHHRSRAQSAATARQLMTQRSIRAAATFRVADPNITDLERSRLRRLVS